jgi:catalase
MSERKRPDRLLVIPVADDQNSLTVARKDLSSFRMPSPEIIRPFRPRAIPERVLHAREQVAVAILRLWRRHRYSRANSVGSG